MFCSSAVTGFKSVNGITLNTEKSELYVADMFDKTVSIFQRNRENGELTHQTTIKTLHAVDNIKFDDETGKIYAGTANSLFGWLKLFPPSGNHISSNIGGVTEITKMKVNGEESQTFAIRDLVVTNKLNGISGGMRMGN